MIFRIFTMIVWLWDYKKTTFLILIIISILMFLDNNYWGASLYKLLQPDFHYIKLFIHAISLGHLLEAIPTW